MQLEGQTAIVYGAAGAMGIAVARAFGAEGATVFLAGRTRSKVRAIADEIASAGGSAEAAEVGVDDRAGVERHADEVIEASGRIDISLNAVGMDAVQNIPLVDISLDDFMVPIGQAARRWASGSTCAVSPMPRPRASSRVVPRLTLSAGRPRSGRRECELGRTPDRDGNQSADTGLSTISDSARARPVPEQDAPGGERG